MPYSLARCKHRHGTSQCEEQICGHKTSEISQQWQPLLRSVAGEQRRARCPPSCRTLLCDVGGPGKNSSMDAMDSKREGALTLLEIFTLNTMLGLTSMPIL